MKAVVLEVTKEELARRKLTGIDRWDEMWEGVLHMAPGKPKEIHRGGTTSGAQITPRGEVVFAHNTLDRPPELAVVSLDGTGFHDLTAVTRGPVGVTQICTFRVARPQPDATIDPIT